MPYSTASAVDIDRKLRDDFRRRVKDFGISTEAVDPVLAVLFRTFAQQIETLYSETGRIRLALLDELIAGLGIDQRVSRPAQTVLRLETTAGPQTVQAGMELVGEAQSGERLTFRTDTSILVSPARLSLALIYQNGALQLPGNFDLPEQFQNLRPSLDPVRVNLGLNPALYLAIENLPAAHLSHHSFFIDTGPDSFAVQQALQVESWCLVGAEGELSSRGVLRPRTGSAGVRLLEWLVRDGAESEKSEQEEIGVTLPQGFYGPRLFIMPRVPSDRDFLSNMPRGIDGALAKIFGRESASLFSQPRAWLRIGFPSGVQKLDTAIDSVSLHCVTASNVECINQTIYFDREGTSIPISQEAGTASHLVAPLSVLAESGASYVPESEPSPDWTTGRYAVRNGRIDLTPARRPDGGTESSANVRVWVTAGSVGNRVGPGQVKSFAQKKDGANLRLLNPAAAAGGATAESMENAQARFARTLLSRDRVITHQDLAVTTRPFDPRIRSVDSTVVLERSGGGLRRVQRVTILLDANDFVDPPAESLILQQDVANHLQGRMLYDSRLSVATKWT